MDLLDDNIRDEQINEFKQALLETQDKSPREKMDAEFSLAWALVRSQTKSNIVEGINLFELLIAKDPSPDGKRAFLLYLAAAYFKIRKSTDHDSLD
jgi:hypothetical protein